MLKFYKTIYLKKVKWLLLYLHIPFCDSKCHYCSFNSYTGLIHLKKPYIDALKRQLFFELERFDAKPKSIESLFIGGGTPSTLDPKDYKEIFALIAPYLCDDTEITIEANPTSATLRWLGGMRDLGVNRLSLGVQSFNDEKLRFLGRSHSCAQAKEAIKNAFRAGFRNISIDLIYGCACDSRELLSYDLAETFDQNIAHLSAYSLTIEEGTKFFQTPSNALDDVNLSRWLVEEIQKKGFCQYEVSNFGLQKSRHNLGYWQHKNYIGIGSGAVGFLNDERFYPSADIKSYIDDPTKMRTEKLTKDDLVFEKIFLGLRSEIGIAQEIASSDMLERLWLLVKEKKLDYQNGRFYATDFFLADEIALFLMP